MSIDLTQIYAALSLPSGPLFISDRGQIVLVVVRHDHPGHVAIERVELGTALAPEVLLRALHTHGALPSQLTPPPIDVVTVPPAAVVVASEVEREPCPNGCGAMLVRGKPGQHLQRCPNRPGASITVEHTANPPTLQSPLSSSDQERRETTAS